MLLFFKALSIVALSVFAQMSSLLASSQPASSATAPTGGDVLKTVLGISPSKATDSSQDRASNSSDDSADSSKKQIAIGPDLMKLFLCKRDPNQNFKACEKAINFFCSGYCTADGCSDCSNRAICLDVCGEVSALMLSCVQANRSCGDAEDLFKKSMSSDSFNQIKNAKVMSPASAPMAAAVAPGMPGAPYPQAGVMPGYAGMPGAMPGATYPGQMPGAMPAAAYPGQMPGAMPGSYQGQPGMPYGSAPSYPGMAPTGAYPGQMPGGMPMGIDPMTGRPMGGGQMAGNLAFQAAGLNPLQASLASGLSTGLLSGFRRRR